jgi:glycosyltransferase involved in cell wall biosynthesis
VNLAGSNITVIIPFYNREEYIDQAVQSVLEQTLKPLEIIIVNDCSRESSRRCLDRYADVCRIVDLPKNVGLAGSRNAGISQARGRFIALLDDDDIWLPQKLEIQHRYLMEHPECSVVHTAVWVFFVNRPDIRYKLFEPGPLPLSQVLTHRQWVIPSTVMIHTEAVRNRGGFDPWFRENEDRDFFVRCCAAGYRINGIDEPLVRFRRSGHNHLAGRHFTMYRSQMKLCWKHKSLYHRVFGLSGIFYFLLESTYHLANGYVASKYGQPSVTAKYVAGLLWRARENFKVKYEVRPDFKDPVPGEA